MKAIRIHGPKDARYEDVPMPEPGLDDVLIKVKAVAICATDETMGAAAERGGG